MQNFIVWRKLKKNFLKNSIVQNILACLIAFYLVCVRITCGLRIHGAERVQPYWDAHKPVLVVFWHNRMALAPFAWRSKNPFFMLISPHADGGLIARVVRWFGIRAIRGSSLHQGGPKSLRTLVKCLKAGASVGLTPDGPRGPCYTLNSGVFMTAFLAQCDTFALSFCTSRHRRLRSWDRFFLPLPFGRGDVVWSTPIAPPQSKEEQDVFLKHIEDALQCAQQEARSFSASPS